MNPTREIRLLALWREDPMVARLTVDLRIDAKTSAVASTWDLFGAVDLDGDNMRPFVLRRDGAIDFGKEAAAFWRTDLREQKIVVGAAFTLYWNEADSGVYRIVKLAELGAKDSQK